MLVEECSSLRLLNGSTMDFSVLQIWACKIFYGVEVAMLHLLGPERSGTGDFAS